MVDLNTLLKTLCESRPVFHSEFDFQHALAWQIHESWTGYSVRLEYPLSPEESNRLDILAFDDKESIAIELKYKKKALKTEIGSESFTLKQDAAWPINRYYFLKDVQRLEQFVNKGKDTTGYAILLTNEGSYWNLPKHDPNVCPDFSIHDRNTIHGTLRWGPKASSGTRKGREQPIVIKGTYTLVWQDYYEVTPTPQMPLAASGKFRYLLVKIIN